MIFPAVHIDLIILLPLAAFLGGLWRLMDGGWYRLPYGSSILGLLVALSVSYTASGPLGLVAGVVAWRGLTQGYEDWDNLRHMIFRGLWVGPAALIAVALPPQLGCPLDAGLDWYAGAYMVMPLLVNAIQPFIRHHVVNTKIEFMEGAVVIGGLALL